MFMPFTLLLLKETCISIVKSFKMKKLALLHIDNFI